MAKRRGKRVPVKRGDHERVLITETLPFETPIIFSGDGFYTRLKKKSSGDRVQYDLLERLVLRSTPKQSPVTIPFTYKIRKGTSEFRKLAVLHPAGLCDVHKFYEKYDEWMIYECNRSPFTLRAPSKISGSFYEKSAWDAINQFKKGEVTTADIEARSRYNPSYFSYKGVTRLYKFFASEEFMDLEKRYGLMRTLDVSRCFDSIYTHSLSWALLGKSVAKENKNAQTSAAVFDELMRNINHGETSGIVIGPEVSRIFAEIIFQTIDLTATRSLERLGRHVDVDYAIRRYVDDIFIFADSTAAAAQVYECYTDSMALFNLYSNPHKSSLVTRPFVTSRSNVIEKARNLIESFSGKIFEDYAAKRAYLYPATIWRTDRTTMEFISAVKSICFEAKAVYPDVSSYMISALCERIKRLVKRKKAFSSKEQEQYRVVASVLLRVMFFLYTVAPSVNSSYRLAVGVTLLLRFFRQRIPLQVGVIEQAIYSEALRFLEAEARHKSATLSTFVSLEAINVLLVIRELGDGYLIPVSLVEALFVSQTEPEKCSDRCYFDIMTCLFTSKAGPNIARLRMPLKSN